MDAGVVAKGLGIGIAVAAPVGPMCVLLMRRTLVAGWRRGLGTGLGIATADGVYAAIAALGLAQISRFMLAFDRPLHVIAGLFLLYLGIKTFLARPASARETSDFAGSTGSAYASALLLTLTNPPTIVSFAAIFTVLAPSSGFDAATSVQTVLGVFLGSTIWWIVVTAVVSALRHAIGPRARRRIDAVAATLLGALGVTEIRRAL